MAGVTLPGMTEESDADVREAVSLRAVTDDDLEAFFAYEHDPEAVRRSRFAPRPRDRFFPHWRNRVLGDPDCLVRTVTVGGEAAGSVVSWTQDGRRFVGYWLGRPYWGRGIGTRALGLFLELDPVRPLYADPFSGNTASVRLLEGHGFEHAGTVRHGTDEHVLLVLGGAAGDGGEEPGERRG